MERMTPQTVVSITQRVASSYPSNTEEYVALAIAVGIVMGVQLSGAIDHALMDDGTFPIPATIMERIDSGDDSIDPTADPHA